VRDFIITNYEVTIYAWILLIKQVKASKMFEICTIIILLIVLSFVIMFYLKKFIFNNNLLITTLVGPKIFSKSFFSLCWNIMNMWNTNNHKKIGKAKWKAYNPKQKVQNHTNEFSCNLTEMAFWIYLWWRNTCLGGIGHCVLKWKNWDNFTQLRSINII
jgi:hypothetical protein